MRWALGTRRGRPRGVRPSPAGLVLVTRGHAPCGGQTGPGGFEVPALMKMGWEEVGWSRWQVRVCRWGDAVDPRGGTVEVGVSAVSLGGAQVWGGVGDGLIPGFPAGVAVPSHGHSEPSQRPIIAPPPAAPGRHRTKLAVREATLPGDPTGRHRARPATLAS